MMDLIAVGFQEILNPTCLLLIFGGTMLGIIFGAIPGLSATMAIALCLPMTYGMDHINGVAWFPPFCYIFLERRHRLRPVLTDILWQPAAKRARPWAWEFSSHLLVL